MTQILHTVLDWRSRCFFVVFFWWTEISKNVQLSCVLDDNDLMQSSCNAVHCLVLCACWAVLVVFRASFFDYNDLAQFLTLTDLTANLKPGDLNVLIDHRASRWGPHVKSQCTVCMTVLCKLFWRKCEIQLRYFGSVELFLRVLASNQNISLRNTGYKHKNLKGKNLKGKNLEGKNLKGKNFWKARTWHKSKANPQGHVTFTTMPFATLLRQPAHFVCVAFVVFVLLFVL